ncbi:MAG: hypothetical protein WA979_00735 [Pacificimonas sp.]
MDRDVTVRFYQLKPEGDIVETAEETLRRIGKVAKRERERDVGNDIRLRLEMLSERKGLLFGDLTRVQTDNLPGHVTDDENARLPVDEIGHSAAFCYEPDTRYLALQFDQKVGVGRFCNYIANCVESGHYGHLPVLRDGALERFEDEKPTKFNVKVSGIANFASVGRSRSDFEDQLEQWSSFFGDADIEIIVSKRATSGGVDKDSVMSTLRRLLQLKEKNPGVTKLGAETMESDTAFNFISQLLREKDTLELLPNDPALNQEKRIRFVREMYVQHRAYLRSISDADRSA